MKSRKDEQFFPKHSSCRTSALERITRGSCITYYSLMFFIAYTFKGHVHVFAGRVKFASHSSCRTSAIFKYFCPLSSIIFKLIGLRDSLNPDQEQHDQGLYHLPLHYYLWQSHQALRLLTFFMLNSNEHEISTFYKI